MGVGDELSVVENSLRDLIELVLRKAHGDSWFEHLGVTDQRVAQWKARRGEEPNVDQAARLIRVSCITLIFTMPSRSSGRIGISASIVALVIGSDLTFIPTACPRFAIRTPIRVLSFPLKNTWC